MSSYALVPGATPRMLRAVRALAEALFATEAGPPPPDRLDWLTGEFDDFLGHAGTRTRLVMRLSLFAVSCLAPLRLSPWRWPPLHALPLAERIEALDRLEKSRAVLPLLALKAILSVLYYEHPDAAREIGFDGACLLPGGSP